MFEKGLRIMRSILTAISALCLFTAVSVFAAEEPVIRITLLGTGSPAPSIERFSQSTLIEAGGKKLLVDAGRGVAIRLTQAGIRLSDIDAVFITHFHHDHISGLADLLITSWLAPIRFGNRQIPLDVYGPQGILEITTGLKNAYRRDNEIRIEDEQLPRAAGDYNTSEFNSNGVVYEQEGLKVTAFEVDHGEIIKPAYGYRVDYAGKSVLVSGDTMYDERIIDAGRGVDVLIHEVAIADPELIDQDPLLANIFNHHTKPEEAGRIFSAVQPKLAVYSHIVFRPPFGADEIVSQTKTTYQGPLLVGEDLTVIDIGDSVTYRQN